MKDEFKDVINEINQALYNLMIFEELLTSLVIFLTCFLFLDFFTIEGVDQFYAIVPAVAYFIVSLGLKYGKSKVRVVENKYKSLDERIRTAEDNLGVQNEIVDALQKEIKLKLRAVEISAFFNSRSTISKVVASIILCFLIIFMNTFGYGGIDVKTIFPPPKIAHFDTGDGEGTANQFAGGPGGGSNIETDQTGMSGVAQLGEDELKLSLEAEGYELNIRDVKQVTKRSFDETFPSDVGFTSAAAFEENIPKEQQEIVNNYFKSIATK